ncbi:MAG: DUF4266 domain-containing protein [Myxococcota bacterium]
MHRSSPGSASDWPCPAAEPHPLHSDLLDHVRRSRESGAGGGLSSGGGCGCD